MSALCLWSCDPKRRLLDTKLVICDPTRPSLSLAATLRCQKKFCNYHLIWSHFGLLHITGVLHLRLLLENFISTYFWWTFHQNGGSTQWMQDFSRQHTFLFSHIYFCSSLCYFWQQENISELVLPTLRLTTIFADFFPTVAAGGEFTFPPPKILCS